MSELFKSKSIFDRLPDIIEEDNIDYENKDALKILREAPEDDNAGNDAAAPADNADTETNDQASDDTGDDNETDTADSQDDANNDEDMGNDEDFDVDTNIDDDSAGDTDTGDSDQDIGDSTGGGIDDSTEEVNPTNTDIFSTLSKEEQSIKIKELKRLFNDLYIYICDMLTKINDISPDEDNIEPIYRVTAGLFSIKDNISYYIKDVFPIKSYIENDIAYNRYLTIIQSITTILNQVASEMEEKVQKDNKK